MAIRVETMRAEISKCYPSWKWRQRCESMPANQVMAIYYKFQRDGRFDRVAKAEKENKRDDKVYHQMTLGELYPVEMERRNECRSAL